MEDAKMLDAGAAAMPPNVAFAEGGRVVRIVDQTELPGSLVMRDLSTAAQCHDAIARLAVRGAPAIGVFAAHALSMLARGVAAGEAEAHPAGARLEHVADVEIVTPALLALLQDVADYLEGSRPTAVNLRWALEQMTACARGLAGRPLPEALDALQRKALGIAQHEADTCDRISELGLSLLEDGMGVITHCNAGPLATCGHGTGIGPILLGAERGMNLRVFADETRPLLQGARLTAYELSRAGVDVTLICDNMASIVMRQGWVQACLVGCDRVAANGDVANKIGTSGLAIVAKHYGVPFYVMCPTSTIDPSCATGADIPIELRDGDEIKRMWYEQPMAPDEVPCYNPSFDVTDHSLVTAIVTERGICRPPYEFGVARF